MYVYTHVVQPTLAYFTWQTHTHMQGLSSGEHQFAKLPGELQFLHGGGSKASAQRAGTTVKYTHKRYSAATSFEQRTTSIVRIIHIYTCPYRLIRVCAARREAPLARYCVTAAGPRVYPPFGRASSLFTHTHTLSRNLPLELRRALPRAPATWTCTQSCMYSTSAPDVP